jgi:hypothetical protein
VTLKAHPFQLKTQNGATHEARALIVATGASPRRLNVLGERELTGRGVSYCATCDGFFFRDRVVAVVGDTDEAAEEALVLARLARRTGKTFADLSEDERAQMKERSTQQQAILASMQQSMDRLRFNTIAREHNTEMAAMKEATLSHLISSGTVSDPEAIRAYRVVRREDFLPEHLRDDAYVDTPLPIGEGQTISAIHMCLIYLELLELKKGLSVLEVGAMVLALKYW